MRRGEHSDARRFEPSPSVDGEVRACARLSVARRAAVPVQAQRRGVVAQCSAAGLHGASDEALNRFARVVSAARGEHGADIDRGGVALQYAVGEKHQAIARFKRQRLDAERVVRVDPERWVGLQRYFVDDAIAQAQWGRVAGVDDLSRAGT